MAQNTIKIAICQQLQLLGKTSILTTSKHPIHHHFGYQTAVENVMIPWNNMLGL
jgi:hypothetical protein